MLILVKGTVLRLRPGLHGPLDVAVLDSTKLCPELAGLCCQSRGLPNLPSLDLFHFSASGALSTNMNADQIWKLDLSLTNNWKLSPEAFCPMTCHVGLKTKPHLP